MFSGEGLDQLDVVAFVAVLGQEATDKICNDHLQKTYQTMASRRSRARTASFKPRERAFWKLPCLRTSWTAVSTVKPAAATTGAAAGVGATSASDISYPQ